MCLLFTEQILQFGLRVEGNRSSFIFCDKSDGAILSVTSNFWSNIQIVRTYILKYNIPNLMSLTTRYLNFETLLHYFEYTSNKIICHILDNIKDAKIHFLTQKHVCCSCTLGKIYQCSFSESSICFSKLLGLIYSNLFFKVQVGDYIL